MDRTPADLLLALVGELPEDSATVAAMRGGAQFRGWTRTEALLTSLIDAVNLNTIQTGNYKKRPKFTPFPRPTKKAKRPKTVADIRKHFGRG